MKEWRMLVFILDFGKIFCELYYVNISSMKTRSPGNEPVTLGSAVHQLSYQGRSGHSVA